MSLDWQRLWGSIAAAFYFALVVAGDTLLQGSGAGIMALLVTAVVVAIMIYRAAPAIQANWERRQRVEGRHPLQPSLARALGTLLIAAGMTLVFYASVQIVIDPLLGDSRPEDAWDTIRPFLILLMPAYMMWPSIELKLRG